MTNPTQLKAQFDADSDFLVNVMPWEYVDRDNNHVVIYRYDDDGITIPDYGWMLCVDGEIRTVYQIPLTLVEEAKNIPKSFSSQYGVWRALMELSYRFREEKGHLVVPRRLL